MNRCLIADDHAMLRDALVGSVRLGWPGAEICEDGTCAPGSQVESGMRQMPTWLASMK